MIKNILFDLDGTLLPMDLDKFLQIYFHSLYEYCGEDYNSLKDMIDIVMKGTYLMVNNDGKVTNEVVFKNYLKSIINGDIEQKFKNYENYYVTNFIKTKEATSVNKYANLLIQNLKSKGYNLILATNPLYPRIATLKRIEWAGLDKDDFTYITTYENSRYSKPNIKFYQEIIEKLNLNKDECIMVGNDTKEDYAITKLGIPCIILKDCLINNEKLELDFSTLKDLYEASKNYPTVIK